MKTQCLCALGAMILCFACGDDGTDDATGGAAGHGGEGHHDADIDEEACEHFTDGPFNPVAATADATSAPLVGAEHTAHQIALPSDGAMNGGFVAYESSEATDIVFFLDADVPLEIRDGSGMIVPVEASCEPMACSDACDTIRGRHVVPLTVGTFSLELGPTAASTVALVHEGAGHTE